ncbi:MAG TPA: hypothetical protein VIM25_03295, partial [Candidatus Limnocylindrales bacterium]
MATRRPTAGSYGCRAWTRTRKTVAAPTTPIPINAYETTASYGSSVNGSTACNAATSFVSQEKTRNDAATGAEVQMTRSGPRRRPASGPFMARMVPPARPTAATPWA